jgi:threonine aldolase
LAELPGIRIDLAKVQTNMVFITVTRPGLNAFELAQRLKSGGVLVNPLGKDRVRAVTHLDVGRDDILAAVKVFSEVLQA